jgi:alcohol dehydrogenase
MQRNVYRMVPKAGSIKNLRLVTENLDSPEANEVTVAVKSIGLNFADIFAMYGLYGATPEGSFVPGLEYSGEVLAIGEHVQKYKVGDRVMGVTRFGGYSSHINMQEQYLSPLPEDWSFEEGAAFLVQALTAYYALVYLGNLKQDGTVLIHSAAGGVGLLANKIAKTYGATTIGAVGSQAKLALLKAQGYDHGIVRGKHFKQDLIKALGDQSLAVVLECIGGKYFTESYELMDKQGRLVVYGSARYGQTSARPNYFKLAWKYLTRAKLDPQKMIEENKSVMGFNLIWLYEQEGLMQEVLRALNKLDIGKPHVGHVYDFEQMHEAIQLFQSGHTVGKVVVNI